MPNNFFQFKQFTVKQDKCAMKVCTDACLFGAYIANELKEQSTCNVLDIGSGTGLLSLMLAQKTSAVIDAAEIEDNAFEQAKENITASSWKEKITISHSDILKFSPNKKYDYIISNPPFFEADLQSPDKKKNAAKHDTALTLTKLLQVIQKLLSDDGLFALLLPFNRSEYFAAEAGKLNFHLAKEIKVKQTPKHNYFRAILIFSKNKTGDFQEEIIIKNEDGSYTPEFTMLLKDYYLYL